MEIDEKRIGEIVKEWFTKTARGEWRRLQKDAYRRIEFIVTMHFLEKYLPKHGLVLDAGGGPGRYTIELAKRGYNVVLLDLVPEMLKLAKKENEASWCFEKSQAVCARLCGRFVHVSERKI